MSVIVDLVAENTQYRMALQNLKTKIENDKKDRAKSRALLDEEELNEVLEIAGLLDCDIDCPCDHFED